MCFFDAGRVVDFLEEHPSIEESQGIKVKLHFFIYIIASFQYFDESILSRL